MHVNKASSYAFAVFLFLVSSPLTACSQNSGKLDRPTADRILRKHSTDIFQQREIQVYPDVQAGYHLGSSPSSNTMVTFLDALSAAGVLGKFSEQQIKADNPVDSYVLRRYELVPQADASPYVQASIVLTLGKPKFNKVTGISQAGNEADVEVEVGFNPTDLYKRADPLVREALTKCTGNSVALVPACVEWSKAEEDVSSTKTVTTHFKKYDDGWRIAD